MGLVRKNFFFVFIKTLEIKAWREYKFEFSRLPIAITNSANIRILNLKSKQEKN